MKKAVFFDRDGIINELVYDRKHGIIDSPMIPSQVNLVYGIAELVEAVKKTDFKTVICSNQPSVGLGKMNLKNFRAITDKIHSLLKNEGVTFDHQYYCMHHPFAKIRKYKLVCNCRKPKIGLFSKAAAEHNLDLSKSWMIGDGVDDIKAGKNAGCKTILLANINSAENLRILEKQLGETEPDFIVKNLIDASDIIKKS